MREADRTPEAVGVSTTKVLHRKAVSFNLQTLNLSIEKIQTGHFHPAQRTDAMNKLEQLRSMTTVVADTGDI
ncbi:MAG: hypothetical protein L3J84_14480, partial [Gammaproteobacteria bacterium]|nr:hypothetical protein [Gammaproteobacteria bacterium]